MTRYNIILLLVAMIGSGLLGGVANFLILHKDDPDYAKRLFEDELNKLADEARGRPLKRGTDFLFVFPDIIVHRRDTPDNLLVIETKKTTSTVSDRFDRRKLVVYREALKYRFAKFLRFRTDPKEGEALIADSDAV